LHRRQSKSLLWHVRCRKGRRYSAAIANSRGGHVAGIDRHQLVRHTDIERLSGYPGPGCNDLRACRSSSCNVDNISRHPVTLACMNDSRGLTIDLHHHLALKHVCDLGPGRLMPRFRRVRRKFGNAHTHLAICSWDWDSLQNDSVPGRRCSIGSFGRLDARPGQQDKRKAANAFHRKVSLFIVRRWPVT
jgi:hypothetical protein